MLVKILIEFDWYNPNPYQRTTRIIKKFNRMKNHLNEKIYIAGGYRIDFLHSVHPYEKNGWLLNYSSTYISNE